LLLMHRYLVAAVVQSASGNANRNKKAASKDGLHIDGTHRSNQTCYFLLRQAARPIIPVPRRIREVGSGTAAVCVDTFMLSTAQLAL
jgi:hypothetical protein